MGSVDVYYMCIVIFTGYGHYIYIEGSSTNSGDTSDLVSTQLRSKTPFCLEFALSMYGTGMGSVNVYTQVSK